MEAQAQQFPSILSGHSFPGSAQRFYGRDISDPIVRSAGPPQRLRGGVPLLSPLAEDRQVALAKGLLRARVFKLGEQPLGALQGPFEARELAGVVFRAQGL